MAWGKYVLDREGGRTLVMVAVVLVTDGASCYYCFRGWHTIYKSQFTLTQYRGEVPVLIPQLAAAAVFREL